VTLFRTLFHVFKVFYSIFSRKRFKKLQNNVLVVVNKELPNKKRKTSESSAYSRTLVLDAHAMPTRGRGNRLRSLSLVVMTHKTCRVK